MHSENEDNSPMIMIRKMRLLLSFEGDNSFDRIKEAQRLFSFLVSIFRSEAVGEAFIYLLEHGAATAWLLQVELGQSEASVYRVIKRLRSMGVVVKAAKIRRTWGTMGGPKPVIWALPDASDEEVAATTLRHQRAISPKYRVAEKWVQNTLMKYLRSRSLTEIDFTEVVRMAEELKTPYRRYDIAKLAEIVLVQEGIKVWR